MSKLNKILIFLLVLLCAGLIISKYSDISKLFIKKTVIEKNVSAILVTFGDKDDAGAWQGEIAPYMQLLKDAQEISAQIPYCKRTFTGKIYNQNVIIAITGVGKVNASKCADSVLKFKGSEIKELFLTGIAGFTPNILTAEKTEPVMIGDVCITSSAIDSDLHYYGADQKNTKDPNPEFWHRDPADAPFAMTSNSSLANDLYTSMKEETFDIKLADTTMTNEKYHRTARLPVTWDPKTCLESSGDLFWHDTRMDRRARELGVTILNTANNQNKTADQIIVASGMEGVSVGNAVLDWNKEQNDTIRFAIVRAASNFDQPVTDSNGVPQESSRESLENNLMMENVQRAIATQALPVSRLLQQRSLDQAINKNQIKY